MPTLLDLSARVNAVCTDTSLEGAIATARAEIAAALERDEVTYESLWHDLRRIGPDPQLNWFKVTLDSVTIPLHPAVIYTRATDNDRIETIAAVLLGRINQMPGGYSPQQPPVATGWQRLLQLLRQAIRRR